MELTNTVLTPFSINSRLYETEMDQKHGLVLAKLENGGKSKFQGDLEKSTSFNKGDVAFPAKIVKDILRKFEGIPGFCSMIIKDEKDLDRHLRNIHEMSYLHYIYGKETNFQGSFPEYCCFGSSKNISLGLMNQGYPNPALFHNNSKYHAYVGLPFIFGDNQEPGFIIVDPTSDQLFDDKTTAPRNHVFISNGPKWVYQTDWRDGSNLYPNLKDNSAFMNLETLRNYPKLKTMYSSQIKTYFSEVFKHPVEVKISS